MIVPILDDKCVHCDIQSRAYKYFLETTDNFIVVADANPIVEGHLLIIPREHISCVGAYSDELFGEFLDLKDRCFDFVKSVYGSCAAFEHGVVGQTVFHSHIHFLPAPSVTSGDIVPEGEQYLTRVGNWDVVRDAYKKVGKYLFFSLGKDGFLVDVSLGEPRFFRDRFARVLGVPERGNWRTLASNPDSVKQNAEINVNTVEKWRQWQG